METESNGIPVPGGLAVSPLENANFDKTSETAHQAANATAAIARHPPLFFTLHSPLRTPSVSFPKVQLLNLFQSTVHVAQ